LDVLLLAAVGLWCFTTAVAGGLVGLVLGNIRLPVIVFVAATPAAGSGANLGISAVAAATAGVAHLRAGRVDWPLVAWMAPPSIAGAVGGSVVAARLPAHVLLLVIGAALIAFGLDLLRPRRRARRRRSKRNAIPGVIAAGLTIGFLGGVVGLILGSLRMPALLRLVATEPARIVGTNLVVGFLVGAAGITAHAPSGVDWTLFGIGAAASVPGAVLGARLTGRLNEQQLLRAVGCVLLVAGAAAVAQGAR
jgi:uncharacterized membrane protein YfcA